MQETMGQIIRRLRKERNLTQEELAEQLGITFQAVSRWENDSGMPDISQVIPLATVFNVSTDVLFGICGKSNANEVDKIIKQARLKITYPATKESIWQCYDELLKGLEKYPNNTLLLSQCLESGISLAYPENDFFDSENGEAIYKECIREANIVIKYSKNTTDVLRAHMIMVLLHSAYGNFEMAEAHANEFHTSDEKQCAIGARAYPYDDELTGNSGSISNRNLRLVLIAKISYNKNNTNISTTPGSLRNSKENRNGIGRKGTDRKSSQGDRRRQNTAAAV